MSKIGVFLENVATFAVLLSASDMALKHSGSAVISHHHPSLSDVSSLIGGFVLCWAC